MQVLVTGASGFIGRVLVARLLTLGHEVTALTRSRENAARVLPAGCTLVENLAHIKTNNLPEVVINLAGAPIADRRWSRKRKALLRDSRIQFTRQLVDWLLQNTPQLKLLISGSALGFYGCQAGHIQLHEQATAADGFTHQLCQDWENQAQRLSSQDSKVVLLRTGLVLGNGGGILSKMLLPFRLGLGGPIASGQQMMSWIHMDDMVNAILFLMHQPHAQGPYNLTAPLAVSNHQFAQTLARVLHRPAFFTLPAFVVQLMLGEGAQLLLEGQNVVPQKLLDAGFCFSYPELEQALEAVLGAGGARR